MAKVDEAGLYRLPQRAECCDAHDPGAVRFNLPTE
jgi:hypothetical protein